MNHYRRHTQLLYALLVIASIWMINYALAVGGDTQIAQNAWPLIEDGALLIDVRTEEEFSQGHIEGAINISHEQTDALVSAIGNDKHRNVVVYCRSGNRSGKAQKALEGLGYTGIFNATGFEAIKATKP